MYFDKVMCFIKKGENMVKAFLLSLVVTSMFIFTGCAGGPGGSAISMEMQGQASTIDDLESADQFTVGQMTEENVLEELGGAQYTFKKENNITKHVWVSSKMVIGSNSNMLNPFSSMSMKGKQLSKSLILKFDEKKVLVYKKFITRNGYMDPDVAKETQIMMRNLGLRSSY